jgi:hypothetical protein
MSNERVTLFKFLTAQGAKKLLESQTLKFTPLGEYNDPFEGDAIFDFALDPETGNVSLLGQDAQHRTLDHGPDLETFWQAMGFISRHSACCFCGRNDSVLLWSHYADEHRGVCLEFQFDRYGHGLSDFQSIPANQCFLFEEVNYSKHRPLLLMNTDEASVVPYEVVDEALFTKSLDWAYEEEWRFVKRDSPTTSFERFRADRLKRIIFGLRCSPEDEKDIFRIAASKYPHAEASKAVKHQYRYAIQIEQADTKAN